MARGRYAEAEPLVVSGYQGLKAREAKIPKSGSFNLPEAAERVVQLYELSGKPEKVAEWRARLGPLNLPEDVFAK